MIGIIGALKEEIEHFESVMTEKSKKEVLGIEFTSGKLDGKDVTVVLSGVGKVNAAMAATALLTDFDIECVFSTGTAGGISAKKHTTVIGTATVQHDFFIDLEGKKPGQLDEYDFVEIPCSDNLVSLSAQTASEIGYTYSLGIIATGDFFVSDPELKNKIEKQFNASACDMESAAIAQICYKAKVPFLTVRTLSDSADSGSPFDYFAFKREAANKNSRLIIEVIKHLSPNI